MWLERGEVWASPHVLSSFVLDNRPCSAQHWPTFVWVACLVARLRPFESFRPFLAEVVAFGPNP
jgi:hypothetical protein